MGLSLREVYVGLQAYNGLQPSLRYALTESSPIEVNVPYSQVSMYRMNQTKM